MILCRNLENNTYILVTPPFLELWHKKVHQLCWPKSYGCYLFESFFWLFFFLIQRCITLFQKLLNLLTSNLAQIWSMGWCYIFISQFSDNRYLWHVAKCIVIMLTLIFCFCVLNQSFLRKYTNSWYILCPPLPRPFGSSASFFIMVARCSSGLYWVTSALWT